MIVSTLNRSFGQAKGAHPRGWHGWQRSESCHKCLSSADCATCREVGACGSQSDCDTSGSGPHKRGRLGGFGVLQSSLQQTNGTIDSFYAYKRRSYGAVNQLCALPYVMCSKKQACAPGNTVVQKGNALYCCPDNRLMNFRKMAQPSCAWIGFAKDLTPYPHPQTHDKTTPTRERAAAQPKDVSGARHRQVVQPSSSGGFGLMDALLLGGVGYVGYKGYKYYKKKKKVA